MDAVREALGSEFEIVRKLGQGAMATVYLAKDRTLGVPVVLKVLRPGAAANETARKRFEREARAAASLAEHPNVVAVRRYGRLPDETPYLVMQYVKGRTLEERLKAEGQLPEAEAREVLRAVASALELAHGKGIVHRDLRPGNVLWDEEKGCALLTDFGIAAIVAGSGEEASRLTQAGQFVGNPMYLSPEQLRDEDVTELTDIYELGVLGYELLTGRGPYDAKRPGEWLVAHVSKPPLDLRSLRSDVSQPLADLLKHCLSKEARHRPSAKDVVRLLSQGTGEGEGDHDVADLVKRRVPQIVGLAVAVSVALIGVVNDLQDRGRLPDNSFDLALVTSASLVAASAVAAWFHGARGRQRVLRVEYALFGLIGSAWLGASLWVILGR
jgi:serine/threonine protein kinase